MEADAPLRTGFPPEGSRRNPHEFSKYPGQLGCIAEPNRERHVAKREIGVGQEASCTRDPRRQYVLVGRQADRVFESPNKVESAQACHVRKSGYGNSVREVTIDKLLHPP